MNQDYFEIKDKNGNVLGRYLVSNSLRCWSIFENINNNPAYCDFSFEEKERLFFLQCKEQKVRISLFHNSDRYEMRD